jgi:hypothetical protein
MAGHPKATIASLNSWKEISLYMDRGIRTVQRWERELGLPIHRVGKGPRSPVHAFPSELTAWLQHIEHNRDDRNGQHENPLPRRDGPTEVSRVLVRRSSSLVQQLMSSMWTQRQRAEDLMRSLEKVRGQLHGNSRHQKDQNRVSPSSPLPRPAKRISKKKRT